jgi:hypothetical protein
MTEVIVSITTIPKRKEMFLQTLPFILQQKYVKKICINLDNNLSQEDYDFYDKQVATQDSRIELDKTCESKWRSANKLLPTIQKYPDDVIVTMDDDLSYDENCVKELVEMYEKNPDCIICQEINPAVIMNGELRYVNTLDIKLMQKEFGKYLSHSCLFPPHVFDDTEVFDFDKMMKLTNGTHDELWFWEQTTLKGVQVIGLDYTISMGIDSTIQHNGDYQLTDINAQQTNIDNYNFKFNCEYADKIQKVIRSKPIEFFVTRENLQAHVGSLWQIKQLYGGFPKLVFWVDDSMKKSHVWYLTSRLQLNKFAASQIEIREKHV